MLRYKKHKRHTDGVSGSGVGVMDDTDREVSSFTDRAFRSLCVAEDELFNDVPHIPSPIRGMPLSTKYHLGIFNLSVRKTQPLAQLPAVPRHRGKWAPTFQPLLHSTKDGLPIAKTNINKLCVPQPTGYKHHSKVSSLIKTFDNIENERPEQDGLFPTKGKTNFAEGNLCENVEQSDMNKETIQSSNADDTSLHQAHNIPRRTAREVFLESQAEMSSRLSGSPCSMGSPLPDQVKKVTKQKESLRRSAFLHSENSAFKSWSDINKRGTDSDMSAPSTPPILRTGTPCSPLLQRTNSGTRAGGEVGWASPASTASSSFDTIQMLRTVPPLPSKRTSKQNKTLKVPVENKIQAEEMQVDVAYRQSPKEQINKAAKSKSPQKLHQSPCTNQEVEALQRTSPTVQKIEENTEKDLKISDSKQPEITGKQDDTKIPDKQMPKSGRIKNLIQQIEKEAIKDTAPFPLPEKKHNLKESGENSIDTLPVIVQEIPVNTNLNNVQVPPWRRTHNKKIELMEKPLKKSISAKEPAIEQLSENSTLLKEEPSEDKPSNFSSFNITNLLTPVIRRKSIQEALEEQPMTVSPPPTNTPTLKDQDQVEHLYHQRNDYKAKATSLLFNLKDMRKRVKSTYNPSKVPRNNHDENNQTADRREPGAITNHGIALLDTIKQEEEEALSGASQARHSNLPKEKTDSCFLGNTFDNYLSLNSPPQVTMSKVHENGDIPKIKLNTDENVDEEHMFSSQISPIDNHIKSAVDYPSLNLYHKEDIIVNTEPKQIVNVEPEWRKEEIISPVENIKYESKQDGPSETVTTSVLERDMESAQSYAEESGASIEMERQWSIECVEDGKEGISNDNLKDELQYYAVSNEELEIKEQSLKGEVEIKEQETESKKKDDTEKLVGEQNEESTNAEEIKRPSSMTQFKPNLFHIKDNTVKSSPITKSVRPLLRSLSEDCLFYRREEDYSFTGKGDFRVTRPSSWKNNHTNTKIHKTANVELHDEEKPGKSVSTQHVLEPPNQVDKIKTQNEEIESIWEKLCQSSPVWIKNEEETAESVKENKVLHNRISPSLNGPFFHPVETCISDVTGLSPECNTLFGHHMSGSVNDLLNRDHDSSLVLATDNTSYSPLENGLLHFEDAVSFTEDIACSTITSPMSESITCSMIASPMSVNTQSSGFTTALSALDDMQSPPLPCLNSRDLKGCLSVPDNVIQPPVDYVKHKPAECNKQLLEKSVCFDAQNKAQAAKPPAVPPKTEKALRRAKRLTKKRRKTEMPQKIQDGDIKESDFILDIPSPADIMQTAATSQSHYKVDSLEEPISQSSTPYLPITQRKLLQDPESGQYFMVEIPVHPRIKTFYDPETGKYLQMSLPQSERSTPIHEMSNSPYMMYQGLAPVPVASIASLKQASRLLNHNGFEIDCDSCDHSMAGTPHSMDRTASSTRSPDIISIRDIDDFAMEAIS